MLKPLNVMSAKSSTQSPPDVAGNTTVQFAVSVPLNLIVGHLYSVAASVVIPLESVIFGDSPFCDPAPPIIASVVPFCWRLTTPRLLAPALEAFPPLILTFPPVFVVAAPVASPPLIVTLPPETVPVAHVVLCAATVQLAP